MLNVLHIVYNDSLFASITDPIEHERAVEKYIDLTVAAVVKAGVATCDTEVTITEGIGPFVEFSFDVGTPLIEQRSLVNKVNAAIRGVEKARAYLPTPKGSRLVSVNYSGSGYVTAMFADGVVKYVASDAFAEFCLKEGLS